MVTSSGSTSVLRSIVSLSELSRSDFRPMFNEVDVVVRVVRVHESPDKMTVDVIDTSQKTGSIVVWGQSKARSVFCKAQNSVIKLSLLRSDTVVSVLGSVGNIVSCRNLEWRPSSARLVTPSLHVTDRSIVTLKPGDQAHKQQMEALKGVSPNVPAQISVPSPVSVTPRPSRSSAWGSSSREEHQRQHNKRKLEMLEQDISMSEHLSRTRDGSVGSVAPSVSTFPVMSSPALKTPFKPPKMSKVEEKTEEFNSEEFDEENANKVMDSLNV